MMKYLLDKMKFYFSITYSGKPFEKNKALLDINLLRKVSNTKLKATLKVSTKNH